VLSSVNVFGTSWTVSYGCFELRAPLDSDIAGYKVYYDTDEATPPYDGQAGVGGIDSPVALGDLTQFTLGYLSNDTTYYVCVTAFDISGNESGYSEVASGIPHLPPVIDLSIRVEVDDVLLNWKPVLGANDYDVYHSADDPFAEPAQMTLLDSTYLPHWQHTEGATTDRGFYRVVARLPINILQFTHVSA